MNKKDWSDLKIFDPKKATLLEATPDLLEACKALIMHRNQGNLHPVDYQRIEQAIAKAEGKVTNE